MSLISLEQASAMADWYFEDAARYHRDQWEFDIDLTFPHRIYLHECHFADYRRSREGIQKVEIRRWIGDNLTRDVIQTHLNSDYHYRNPNMTFGFGSRNVVQVDHRYHCFHFEQDSDAALFKLTFSDVAVGHAAERHPHRDDIPEDWICTSWGEFIKCQDDAF